MFKQKKQMQRIRQEKHNQFLAPKRAELVEALRKFNEVSFVNMILPSFATADAFQQELRNGQDIHLS